MHTALPMQFILMEAVETKEPFLFYYPGHPDS